LVIALGGLSIAQREWAVDSRRPHLSPWLVGSKQSFFEKKDQKAFARADADLSG
jgi:hypothetical protein